MSVTGVWWTLTESKNDLENGFYVKLGDYNKKSKTTTQQDYYFESTTTDE